jgi:hypothetical protein
MGGYDAAHAGFLPVKRTFWACAAALILAGFAASQGKQVAATASNPVPYRVMAGSGSVDQLSLPNVEGMVAAGLEQLLPQFQGLALQPFVVWLHGDRETLPPHLGQLLHHGVAGFTLLGQRQIHLVWGEMQQQLASAQGVTTHELVHELLDQWVGPHSRSIPRWFHEGLAQVMAGDTYLGAREEDLVWRIGTDRLLPFSELRDGFPRDRDNLQTAYAQSYSYVAWLVSRYGTAKLLATARRVDAETSFDRALVEATRRTTLELQDGWLDHLRHGSGAFWRGLNEQTFHLVLLAGLPLLWLAFRRRSARERRAAERLSRLEAAETAAAAVAPAQDFPQVHGNDPQEPEEDEETAQRNGPA